MTKADRLRRAAALIEQGVIANLQEADSKAKGAFWPVMGFVPRDCEMFPSGTPRGITQRVMLLCLAAELQQPHVGRDCK